MDICDNLRFIHKKIYYFAPMEVFLIQLKLAFIMALIICFPYIAKCLWDYLLPALYENEKRCKKELMLPHPFIGERAFVMVPMKDILPELCINNIDYKDNYNNCDKSGVKKVSEINIQKDLCI